MVEKVSQANSSSNNLPNIPAVAPTSDTSYIQPVIGKLGFDTEHPDIFGIGSSPDNGVSFHVWASFKGLVLDKDDMEAIWIHGVSDRVKSEVNSATAEIPAVESAANEGVRKAENAIASSKVNSDAIANMKSAVSAVKSDASAAASDAIKDLNGVKSATSSAYQELHSSVASNQVILDSTSKSLDGLATDLSKYAQDAVSQGKTIAQLQKSQDSVKTTVADVQGDVAQLKIDASSVGVTASNNKNDIASLKLSASSASLAIKDANSNAAVATATASQAYVGLQDAKSNIASVQATANGLKGTMANAQSDINQVKADAQGMHEQIANANSQIADISTDVNGLHASVSKVDSSVNDLSKATQANTVAINETAKKVELKANQTAVDDLGNSVKSQAASLEVANNQLQTKASYADVERTIDGKGYVTKDVVESIVTQKADMLTESIASVNGRVQNITASIDGLQSTVKGKADMSKVTQLADALQFKVTGVYITQTDLLKLTKNDVSSESVLTGPQLNNLASVVKGAKVQLSFDYVTDSDIGFYPILTGAPNEIGGSYPFGAETIYAQKGVKGTYSKTITVNDGWVDSKETNLAFAVFNNGTITFTNLVLKLADSTKGDAQSMFNIMQDQMNLRVTKDNLISQINLSAGNTLIQSNKIFLDADSVVFSKNSKAFIPSAAITNLEADKVTTGTLNGVEIRQLETGGRSIDIKNGNIAITSHDPYEPRISFTNDGKNMKMFNALGDLEVINQEFSLFNFTPDDTSSTNPIPFFRVVNTGNTGSGTAHLYMDHAIIDGNEWWTPAGGITFGRTWDGTNTSSDYVDLYAKSFVPHSELSAKTRIKKLDRKEALDKIMQDDMYTYQFKEDVRDGVSKRYASFIIDNVHDVAQYAEPEEFLSANGKGRDDGTQLAYLIAAVQYQQEQIEELKKKLEEK